MRSALSTGVGRAPPSRLEDAVWAGLLSLLLLLSATLERGGLLRLPGGLRMAPTCWLHALTGYSCPFCGMTRSFAALAGGDLRGAFAMHPAGPLLCAAMLATILAIAWAAVSGRPPIAARPTFQRAVTTVLYGSVAAGTARLLFA